MKILIKWKNGNITAFHREIEDNQITTSKFMRKEQWIQTNYEGFWSV